MSSDTKCSLLPRGQAAPQPWIHLLWCCGGFLFPQQREDRSLSRGWCWSQGARTEAAFGRRMLRVAHAGEGTDSSLHQPCSSASTAQKLFYHHTLSFPFSPLLEESKAAQGSSCPACCSSPLADCWSPCALSISPSSWTGQG